MQGDLLEGAIKFAQTVAIPGGTKGRQISKRTDKLGGADAAFFAEQRKAVAARARGQIAPVKIVDALEAAATLPFADGMKKEREIATELMAGTQSKALRHVFFAEREAAKIPDIGPDTPVRPVKSVAIIGAGTMGGGIAMNFANVGMPVTLIDSTDEFLDRGLKRIKDNYAVTVSRGRLSQADMDKRLGLIKGAIGNDKIKDADLVIEAVFEEMDLKKTIYRDIDKFAKPGAILATNTSGLNIDEIAAVTKRPQDVIGMHFFSPANVMRLIEIVRADKTGKDVVASAMAVGKQIRKVPVLARVYEGFIGNAMLRHYAREAHFLLEEGALAAAGRQGAHGFRLCHGHVRRPRRRRQRCRLSHAQGRDRDASQRPALFRHHHHAVRHGPARPEDRQGLVPLRAGQPRRRSPIPRSKPSSSRNRSRRASSAAPITAEEIVKRCVYGPINEGAMLLEKGIALRPSDIDIVYVTGYGFPSWRGGPMFYADTVGLASVLDDIKRFHERDGFFWRPAPLLGAVGPRGQELRGLSGEAR